MRVLFIAIVTVCLLVSCKHKRNEIQNTGDTTKQAIIPQATVKKDTAANIPSEADRYYDSIKKATREYAKANGIPDESDVEIDGPLSINFDIYSKRDITISSPFKIDTALKQLFGGKTYTVVQYDRILFTTFWNNYKAPKNKSIPSTFIGDEFDISFPGNVDWETRFEDSFYYSVNGSEYLAMFFSSFQSSYDLMRTGRFACAVLGVAVFKHEGNDWHIELYNPSIGCFGMFGNPHRPHKIALGDSKYGFYLTNGVQGGGGPYYGDIHFFRLSDNIPQILTVSGIERFNTLFTNWWYNVETQTGVGNENYNLKINIEGYINKDDLEVDEEKDWPKQYVKLVEKGGNYKFNHSQTFIPRTNGTYKLDKETFDYKSWPIDTVNGNTGSKQAWFLDF